VRSMLGEAEPVEAAVVFAPMMMKIIDLARGLFPTGPRQVDEPGVSVVWSDADYDRASRRAKRWRERARSIRLRVAVRPGSADICLPHRLPVLSALSSLSGLRRLQPCGSRVRSDDS
jgi:hypothetical protein